MAFLVAYVIHRAGEKTFDGKTIVRLSPRGENTQRRIRALLERQHDGIDPSKGLAAKTGRGYDDIGRIRPQPFRNSAISRAMTQEASPSSRWMRN
jgi:hypothetical protein